MKKGEIKIRVKHIWNIVITNNKKDLINNEGHLCKGIVKYKDNIIYIDEEILERKNDLYHLLKHELTHIFLYETQIELKETYSEENLCELVALYSDDIIRKARLILRKLKKL